MKNIQFKKSYRYYSVALTHSDTNNIKMYGKCVPVVAASLSVLALGVLNPELLQKKENGKASGSPDPKLLALVALVTGLSTCLIMKLLRDSEVITNLLDNSASKL